jgi:two-component system, LytTR family, response regulator
MNCLIVDDEPLAREIIEGYIRETPGLSLHASCKSALEALSYINSSVIDVIFLDIQMPELDGLQFLSSTDIKTPVILTTAHQEYALKGYELDVIDYLLKPIRLDRFLLAVSKLKQKKLDAGKNNNADTKKAEFLFVKSEYKIHRVDLESIMYIEGLKDYLIIQMPDQKLLSLMSFNEIEPFLSSPRFVRIHKSFVIALNHITSVEKSLVNIGERQIPIGRTYRKSFFEIVDQFKVG